MLTSYERLVGTFRDCFGLGVSKGALMNMFIRSHPAFKIEADKAIAILRQAKVVASDETGVRIEGTNSSANIQCKALALRWHQSDYSRAARMVVTEKMAGHVPDGWISDRYVGQQEHGLRHQTCLASAKQLLCRDLARDTAFAFDHGSDDLPLRFNLWYIKAFALVKDIASFAASTLASKKRELQKQLADILAATTGCQLASALQAKIARARDQLLTFCDYPGLVCAMHLHCRRGGQQQWIGAGAAAQCHPAKSHQRLQGHVGSRSRSRRAHYRRYRKADWRKPLQDIYRYAGVKKSDCDPKNGLSNYHMEFVKMLYLSGKKEASMPISRKMALSKRKFLKISATGVGCTLALAGCATFGLPKIAKATAGYNDHPRGVNHCHDCLHFEMPHACSVVEGAISPGGVCKYFLKRV